MKFSKASEPCVLETMSDAHRGLTMKEQVCAMNDGYSRLNAAHSYQAWGPEDRWRRAARAECRSSGLGLSMTTRHDRHDRTADHTHDRDVFAGDCRG
jgi:hypothetical protein